MGIENSLTVGLGSGHSALSWVLVLVKVGGMFS